MDKNIMLIHPSFYVNGGAERQIAELCNYLTDNNYKVTIFTVDSIPEFRRSLKETRICNCTDFNTLRERALVRSTYYQIINPHNHPAELILYPRKHKIIWQCFPNNTIVYANEKLDRIQNISMNNMLLCDQKVQKLYSRKYRGKLKIIKPSYLMPIKITPEHPIKIFKAKRINNKWNIIDDGNWVEVKRIPERTLTTKYCVAVPKIKDEFDYLLDLTKYSKRSVDCKFKGVITEDIAELLGWYFAEGSVNGGHVDFALNINEINYANRILSIANSIGINGRINKIPKNNSLVVRINSTSLARFLIEKIGHNANDKIVPGFMFGERKSIIQSFIDAIQKGDGDINIKPRKTKYSAMKRIGINSELGSKGIQILLMKIGIVSGLSRRKQKESMIGDRLIKSDGYEYTLYWSIDGNFNNYLEDNNNYYLPISRITEEDYNGTVYNLETTNNFYCVPFIVHNCNEPPETVLRGGKLNAREIEIVKDQVDKAFVISDFDKRRFIDTYGFEPIVNYPGIRYSMFADVPNISRDDKEIRILQFGYFCWTKNQIKTVEIFNEVLKSIPNAILYLVGYNKDPYFNKVKEKIAELGIVDKVRINGYNTSDKEIVNLYKSVDIFINPVLDQGGYATSFEAVSSGLPTVVSDKFVASNLCKDHNLAEVSKIEDFVSVILSIINNLDKNKEKISNNKLWIKDNLTWNNFGKKYESVISELV